MKSGLNIKIFNKVDTADWDSALIKLGGTIKHSSGWSEYIKNVKGKIPLYIIGYKSTDSANHIPNFYDNVIMMAVCFTEESSLPIIASLSRSVTFESFPAIQGRDPIILKDIVQSIENCFKNKKYRSLTFESSQSELMFEDIDLSDYDMDKRYEFKLDLTPSAEILWKQLKESHKRKIKSVEKTIDPSRDDSIMEVYNTNQLEDLLQLRELQINSSENAFERGDGYSVGDREKYIRIKEYLLDKKLAQLYLTRLNKDVLSGALITVFNQIGYYMYGGSSKMGFEMSSSYYQFWKIMLLLKKDGFRELNLGGVPMDAENNDSSSHGLYRFKRGFGAQIKPCFGGTKTLHHVKEKLYNILKK